MQGYVKIYRSLEGKGYYKQSEYVHLWVHLIMKATYQSKEFLFNNKIEHLKTGQFICGRKSLSKETGINESKIERILNCFESEQQIEQQKNNKFRIISILNWNEYQQSEQQIEQPVNNQRTTSEQPVNTNKKDKKDKKDNIPKTLFLDSVLLTTDETIKLKEKFNGNFNRSIEILNNYKMQSGKKYKSDYHAMIGWVAKEIEKTPEKKSSW